MPFKKREPTFKRRDRDDLADFYRDLEAAEPPDTGGFAYREKYRAPVSASDILAEKMFGAGLHTDEERDLPAYRVSNALLQGLTARRGGYELPEPDSRVMAGTEALVQTAGMMPWAVGGGGALGALGVPGIAAGAGALGSYEAAAPADDAAGRIQNTVAGAVTGGLLSAAHAVPFLRAMTKSPVTRFPYDVGVFGGMHMAQTGAEDPLMSLAVGAGGALAAAPFAGMGAQPAAAPRGMRPGQAPWRWTAPESAMRRLSSPMDTRPVRPEAPQTAPESAQAKQAPEPVRDPAEPVSGQRGYTSDWYPGKPVEPSPERPVEVPEQPTAMGEAFAQHTGSKMNRIVQDFRFRHQDPDAYMAKVESTPLAGELPPERMAQIETTARNMKRDGKLPKGMSADAWAEKTALRESLEANGMGDFVEWVDSVGPTKPSGAGIWLDPTRTLQGVGGGGAGYGNMLEKHILAPTRDNIAGGMEMRQALADRMHGPPDGRVVENNFIDMTSGQIAQGAGKYIATEGRGNAELREAWLKNAPTMIEQFVASPEGQAILAKAPTPELARQAIEQAKADVAMWDKAWEYLNRSSVAHGYEEVPYQPGYFPDYRRGAPWFRLDMKVQESLRPKEGARVYRENADASDTGLRKVISRELEKTDSARGERDWSRTRGIDRFAAELSRKAVYQAGLHHDYALARYMELSGQPNGKAAAEIIRKYSQSNYNDARFGWHAAIEKATTSGGPAQLIADTAWWHRQRLADAVFSLNLAWNLGIQPTSMALAGGGGRPQAFGSIVKRYMSPEFRSAMEKSFARIIKGQETGSISGEAQQAGTLEGGMFGSKGDPRRARYAPSTKAKQTLKEARTSVNRILEKELDLMSAAIGHDLAVAEHGMVPGSREAMDFASNYAMKTQSVYNRQWRPEILRGRLFNITVPFGGFGLEATAGAAEGLGARAVGVKPLNNAKRIEYAIKTGVAVSLAALWAKQFGRDAYGPQTIPGVGLVTGKQQPIPMSVYKDYEKIADYIRRNRWDRALGTAARSRMPGGLQIYNAMKAHQLHTGQGEYYLPAQDIPVAIFMGHNMTAAGKKYQDEAGGWKQIWVRRKDKKDKQQGGGARWQPVRR